MSATTATTEDREAMTPGQEEVVAILYTNWRGETGPRKIIPGGDDPESPNPWFGSTEWHPEPQYLLSAWDVEKEAYRDFACANIKAWGDAQVSAVLAASRPVSAGGAEGLREALSRSSIKSVAGGAPDRYRIEIACPDLAVMQALRDGLVAVRETPSLVKASAEQGFTVEELREIRAAIMELGAGAIRTQKITDHQAADDLQRHCIGRIERALASRFAALVHAPKAGGGESDLFDRLHIEKMVRDWCDPVSNSQGLPPGFTDGLVTLLRKRLSRASAPQPAVERVEVAARALLNVRGFHYAEDPMEFGQDAFDITVEALDEAHAILTALADLAALTPAQATAGVPDGFVLVPRDDHSVDHADSRLPLAMIEAGHDAYVRVRNDLDNYVPGETPDWDAGMTAVAIYRAMIAAAPTASGQAKTGYLEPRPETSNADHWAVWLESLFDYAGHSWSR